MCNFKMYYVTAESEHTIARNMNINDDKIHFVWIVNKHFVSWCQPFSFQTGYVQVWLYIQNANIVDYFEVRLF